MPAASTGSRAWQRPATKGVSGLYAQLLGDERFTPYAVLSSEQYLPYQEHDPLPPRIAAFVERELMQGEIAQAMFDLVFQGLDPSADAYADLRQRWDALIAKYIPRLGNVRAARPGDFSRRVLRPMRAHPGAWSWVPRANACWPAWICATSTLPTWSAPSSITPSSLATSARRAWPSWSRSAAPGKNSSSSPWPAATASC